MFPLKIRKFVKGWSNNIAMFLPRELWKETIINPYTFSSTFRRKVQEEKKVELVTFGLRYGWSRKAPSNGDFIFMECRPECGSRTWNSTLAGTRCDGLYSRACIRGRIACRQLSKTQNDTVNARHVAFRAARFRNVITSVLSQSLLCVCFAICRRVLPQVRGSHQRNKRNYREWVIRT